MKTHGRIRLLKPLVVVEDEPPRVAMEETRIYRADIGGSLEQTLLNLSDLGEPEIVEAPVFYERKRGSRAQWEVTATPDVMIRVKRLFPRASAYRSGSIRIADTPEVARDLEWLCDRWPMEISEADRLRLTMSADAHRENERAVHEILTGQRPHREFREPARPARDYQLVAADLAAATGRLLLADDVGLGKSMSGLLVLRDPEALPALVVTLTHLPMQWLGELEKTLPWLRAHIVRSLRPYDPARRREFGGVDPDVLIMPWSKLRGWGDHLAGRIRTVIFDEVQELRRSASWKYVAAAQVADRAVYRLGLTATPVYNYGGEIHNIVDVLAPDLLGSREEFVREWCGGKSVWTSRGNDKTSVDDPAALGVYLREQGLMLRRTRKEVGRELPEVIRVPHSIDADEDVFEELALDVAELAELIVARAGTKEELFRARGDFDWKMRHATGVAKAGYVAEFTRMLLDSGEPVVLFGWHRDVYDIWNERLKAFSPAFYTGTESPTKKHRNAGEFLMGKTQLLVMSLRAGAGLDGLQEVAHVAVFGELDWSPAIHDQCIGRLHRDGQEEPVVAYFLVSDHGADPVMAEVLQVKRTQSEPIRDPDAPLFQVVAAEDRVRLLAQDILARRKQRREAA